MAIQKPSIHSGSGQDPRWTAVDDYTLSHLHPSSRPNHAALTSALERCDEAGIPDISAQPTLSKFLALQCRLLNVKHAVEVGTGGGYTSIFIASENPQIHITSAEINPKRAEAARQNIANAGLSERVEVVLGSGLDVLTDLLAKVESGEKERIGFAFIDADKVNNWAYFDLAVKMSVKGACIVVDNVVQKGAIVADLKELPTDEDLVPGSLRRGTVDHVMGARKVIEEVGKDPRVDGVVLQIVGEKDYDGILMAVVK
jgi:predicted O-methyltransferase YrrM